MTVPLVERAIKAAKLRHTRLPHSVRRAQGVVHTPAEVAEYAVLRVDALLREQLACSDGISDRKVCALDPALGTGVWLAAWLDRLSESERPGPELVGFDVDGAAVEATRALLGSRARLCATSLTLSEANTLAIEDPWGPSRRKRVRVILGNPPWGARSGSRGLALSDAWLREFRSDARGASLGERRSGVLSDDYVRFFRWALEQARRAEHGALVCLATNSSFLDGPVHRGMREALLMAFDSIELLDLGGNALRGTHGARDENLFGVRVGTCLTLGVRVEGPGERKALVSYARLTGSVASKLSRLNAAGEGEVALLEPHGPRFLFVPRARVIESTEAFSLCEAFPFHREGLQTNRDALVTDVYEANLRARLGGLVKGRVPFPARLCAQQPALTAALKGALEANHSSLIAYMSYRPLEERAYCALPLLCHRPRPELARAVSRSSLSLLSARKDRGHGPWNLFGVVNQLADACYLSTRSSCRTRVFPSHGPGGQPNLGTALSLRFQERIGHALQVETLIAYCVGVLSAESFRREHDHALHEDYPLLPLPMDRASFASLSCAGQAWIDAWLAPVDQDDGMLVGSICYDASAGVLRSADRRIETHSDEWAFRVGDFAVLPRVVERASALSWGSIDDAIRRVRGCVAAAASAEAAYRATRPVGCAAKFLAGSC